MKRNEYEVEAEELGKQLPLSPRLAVIGSTSYWGRDSDQICQSVGTHLAGIEQLVLITGGMTGVGESVGRSFFKRRVQEARDPDVYHVLPHGDSSWDYGVTLFAGLDFGERREVLGRLAPMYLLIEGGPGTAHEAEVALSREALLIPICRTGGFSKEIYPRVECPHGSLSEDWRTLANGSVRADEIGAAVCRIVETLARERS